ncbi:hypothetical protein D3C76_1405610 [compost metagenome]
MLEDHAVAGHQCRNDRIHCGEVGVIPRCDHQHGTHWLAFDIAAKTRERIGFERRQGLRRNGDHVPGTLFEAAQLAGAIAHRAAHLPGQFGDDVILHGQHRVHRGAAKSRAFAQRPALPLRLGGCGRRQCLLDLHDVGVLALGEDPAIDRRDYLNSVGHGALSSARSRAAVPSR